MAKVYNSQTASEQSFFPETDKVIGDISEHTGSWSSAQISGQITAIEFTPTTGDPVDKSADLGGVEFTGLITAGFNFKITSITLASGTAILYK